ncbi:hypothetical protein M948_19700 [Virgibacillus sp. CM-4]|nr:hypothetical protein M948_19700 [Virgibacillus sp. CM-4]
MTGIQTGPFLFYRIAPALVHNNDFMTCFDYGIQKDG